MAFAFTFPYDHKVKIGTDNGDDVFATRVKRGKEHTIVYHIGDAEKPVPLKTLHECTFLAPLTPKALDGLNALGKGMDPETNLVIQGVLASEDDGESENGQASGSNLTSASGSAKRGHAANEEDEPSKKRARVRAAETLSEALVLLQEAEEDAKKGKDKLEQPNDLAKQNGEKSSSPSAGESKSSDEATKDSSHVGDDKEENVAKDGVGNDGTVEGESTGNVEDGDEAQENNVKEQDVAEDSVPATGTESSNAKVNGTKANGAKVNGTKAGGTKTGGAKTGGVKAGGAKTGGAKAGAAKTNGTKANAGKKVTSPKAKGGKAGGTKAKGKKAKGEAEDGVVEADGED